VAQSGGAVLPEGFDFAAIALPQNPGGVANIEPSSVINSLERYGLLAGLDAVPHLSCKDANTDAITSSLVGFKQVGIWR